MQLSNTPTTSFHNSNTPSYSSIRPSTNEGHLRVQIYLQKVLNPLAVPMTLLGSHILF